MQSIIKLSSVLSTSRLNYRTETYRSVIFGAVDIGFEIKLKLLLIKLLPQTLTSNSGQLKT
jgi:hypothetical protein